MNRIQALTSSRLIAFTLVLALLTVPCGSECDSVTFAQEAAKLDSAEILTEKRVVERVTTAVDRSLEYLAAQQRPDGAWDGNNAPNALALLAFMGRGHVPGRGPYRDVLEKGKNFILRTQNDNGVFVPQRAAGSGPMYQQGLTTLAMAEMYGMDPDPKLEEALRKAVDLLVRCQSNKGGWRYQPKKADEDLSVTVMQIVALRAANNAEIPVPVETIEKAVGYVKSCHHKNGGYGYQKPEQRPPTSAAGIVSLQLLGRHKDETIPKSLDYLAGMPVEWGNGGGISYYYYFHYYAIQANYQAGGKYWANWHPRVRELFLDRQNVNGSWDLPGGSEKANVVGPNKVYWTAMASLVLEIYMHFLPAYQR
ncbi:MAG: terpene cyclase/mutase family protein [Pirellulaceae bacterium]|nr:terpene cyclase/mutase family protein [Pirellulaceae bacterium]MDP6722027.1 terpene cyclase/mutase family protein [Pirellulaceae bacterium]